MAEEIVFDEDFLRRLEALKIIAAKAAGGVLEGTRLGHERGGHVEFKDFRKYSPGDEIRYVDWNVYARIGKLFIKEFAREAETSVSILVDSSASMGFGRPTKYTVARRIAAALAYVGLAGMDSVSVATFSGGELAQVPVKTGTAQIHAVMSALEAAPCGGRSATAESVKAFLASGRARGTAVIVSDLWDESDGGPLPPLRVLAEKQLDLVVIHVLAPEEVAPVASGRLLMSDAETGESIPAEVGPATRSAYAGEVEKWLAEAEGFASRHSVRYVRALTEPPFEEIVLHYLRRGRVLE